MVEKDSHSQYAAALDLLGPTRLHAALRGEALDKVQHTHTHSHAFPQVLRCVWWLDIISTR